jgi:hypothetical protein
MSNILLYLHACAFFLDKVEDLLLGIILPKLKILTDKLMSMVFAKA